MSERLWIIGPREDGWSLGATADIEFLAYEDLGQAQNAPWVIDPSSGPLTEKRQRLWALEELGVQVALTASTTATVAAQQYWLKGTMRLVGCDPLLMMAGGHVQTVVQATDVDFAWLSSVWPDRRFVATEDSVGLVFSREILPIVNEAADFLSKGVPVDDIDRGVCLGLNYPRGPIAWANLFGWSEVFWGLWALQDMYGERFRPHPWIRKKVGSSLMGELDC